MSTSPPLSKIASILDIKELQSIMQSFTDLTHMVAALLDLDGNVLIATGWQAVCTRFHRKHPEAAKRCTESDLYLAKNLKPGEHVEYQCKNGLWDVATPLFVDGEHLGNVYTGQFFYDDVPFNEEFFTTQADIFGFDRFDYLNAVQSVPRFNRETVRKAIGFLVQLAEYMSRLGSIKMKLEEEIGQRREAEKNALKNQLLFHSVIRAIPDLVWLKDLQGAYISCNKRFERLFDAKEKEIIGKSDYDFVSKLQADSFRKYDQQAIARGRPTINEEEITFADDGHTELVETIKTPIFDSEGRVFGVLGIARDISRRKQTENDLRYKEILLEEMGRIAKIGAWEFKPQTGEGTWTDEVARIHDLDPSEKTSLSKGVAYYKGSSKKVIEKAIQDAVNLGKPYDLELELISAKNVEKWVHTVGHPVVENGKVVLVRGSFQDITDRKNAEAELRKKDALLEEMGRIAKIGGWEIDPASGEGTWTAEAARIHDLDPTERISVEKGLDFYLVESRKKIEQAIQNIVESGTPYDLELEMVSAKGIRKWVYTGGRRRAVEGKNDTIIGYLQDVTERKQAEILYRENNERLRLALQAAQMGTWVWHVDQNKVFWSPETQTIFGVTDVSFGGTYDAYLSFIPMDMRKQIDNQVQAFLSKAKVLDVIHYEHEIVRSDGASGWVEVRGTLLNDDHERPNHMTGICVDITDRKRTDLELEAFRHHLEELVSERTAQLEAANKELEAFSYSVSHDLRAPLRAVDGYTRILSEDYGTILDDEGRRVCGIISDSAREMGRLIDDLLAFSRVGRSAMKPSPVDMATLANSIFCEVITETERQRIDWRVGSLPHAVADPMLMRQVWMNLLTNAVKFTSNRERAIIEVVSYQEMDEIVYCVRDNGVGFDMRYSGKLFGVFQRLHSMAEFPGTGVGLAIVQRIVHRHGGRVWATGEIDSGATFCFSLRKTGSDSDSESKKGE